LEKLLIQNLTQRKKSSIDFSNKPGDTLRMERINSIILLLIIVSTVFFGTACMTSQGSLFEDVVSTNSSNSSDDSEDISDNKEDGSEEEEEEPGLTIRTFPFWCDVYIGDYYAGISPVTELLSSGNYKITVEKEGYYSVTEWVTYTEDERMVIDIDLEPIMGFLYINAEYQNIKISTAWEKLYTDLNELRIGTYLIKAELFGFEPWEQNVSIYEDQTTNLTIEMEPAEFRISDLVVNRKAFNPDNPSGLGESRISFDVTTYGTGELEIFSMNGESVLKHNFSSFTKSEQGYSWNGKDSYGKKLPDGSYRLVVSGRDLNGNNSELKETEAVIDSSLIIRIRNVFSGVSGTLFCPTPDILPTDSFQLTLDGLGHIEEKTGNYRFPIILGARGVPVKDLEISIQTGVFIQKPAAESYIFSISAKKAILPARNFKPVELSWTMKGTFLYDMYTDTQTNFTGLSGGVTASVSAGPLAFILAPEITVSPFKVSYTDTPDPGFYIWGYGRAALLLDLGPIMAGVSAAVRTTTFTEGFSIDYPLSAGAEIHLLIPGTGIFITGIVSGEFRSMSDFYINAGGGVGIIN
jgi:hypothetical protein